MGDYVNNLTDIVKLRDSTKKYSSKSRSDRSLIKERFTLTLSKTINEIVELKDTVTRYAISDKQPDDRVSVHDSALITPTFGARSVCEMWYGGYKFVPAPLIAVQRELIRSGIGDIFSIRTTINCNGTLVLIGGTKQFGRLDSEQFVQLKNALSLDNERLVILHENGAFVQNVFPRVEGFSTEEGVWVDKIRYSFSFVYEELVGTNTYNVQSYSDDWNFTQPADGRIQLTHSVSAKVDLSPSDLSDKEKEDAVMLARQFCESKSGLSNIPRGLYSSVYNYVKDFSSSSGAALITEQLVIVNRQETVKVDDGTYSFNETYEQASSSSNVNISISVDETGSYSITVSGSIIGIGRTRAEKEISLEEQLDDAISNAYNIAAEEYAKTDATGTLNGKYSNKSVGINKGGNTGDYSITFTDKGYSSTILSEDVQISDRRPVAQYAVIPIPGRAVGPVVQDLGTLNEGEYTVSGTIVGTTIEEALARGSQLLIENTGNNKGSSSRITNAEVTKNIRGKSVSFNYTWTYQGDEAADVLS